MRNHIRVSVDFGVHYTATTCTSTVSATDLKNSGSPGISSESELDHGFGIGLHIPLDSIDDIFWATDDLAGWFFDPNGTDVSGYFDDFDDKGNLIVPEEKNPVCPAPSVARVKASKKKESAGKQVDDHKSRGINNMLKKSGVRPLDKAAFEPKPTSTHRKIKAKQPGTAKVAEYNIMLPAKSAAQKALVNEKSVSKKSDEDQNPREMKAVANNMKKSVVRPLDKEEFEQKLTATKRKIQDAYEEKAKNRRAIKVVEFIPPTATKPQTKKRATCHKKDAFQGMKKDFFTRPTKRPKMV